MFRAAVRQPFGEHFAKAAKCARDQVCAIRLHRERRHQRLAAPRDEWLGKRHDHFAGVLALRHQSERHINAARRERAEWQRLQRALRDEAGDLFQQLPRALFIAAENRVHRDDVE